MSNAAPPSDATDAVAIKVLVIDDSNTIRRSAEIFLKQGGYQVLLAEDGFDALSKVNDHDPDLIFCDILMPRLDGYQTCAIIKRNATFSNVPVVMLSSKDGVFDKARGRMVGSQDYLTKPFTKDQLLHGLQKLVLGEGFGEIGLGADHAAARLVEQPVLGRQHDHRHRGEARVALDDRAGLVAIEPRHQDVAEDQLRVVVIDLGQRVEAVFGQHHFVAALAQKDFGTAANRVAVVDDQHFGGRGRPLGHCVIHEWHSLGG